MISSSHGSRSEGSRGRRPVIVVYGARSGAGKTRVVELALDALHGWAAIKVTPHLRHAPPGTYSAGVVMSDAAIPPKPGSDTDRYARAGAARRVWVQAPPEALPLRLLEALHELENAPGVLVEGGFASDLLPEASRVFVCPHDEPSPKPPALLRASRAHAWVWTWPAGGEDLPSLPSPGWSRRRLPPEIPQFRLRLDRPEAWDGPELLERFRAWARG